MYIKYTFVEVASFLIYQVFGAVPLPVTVPLTTEALSLGFGFNLGFLHWSGNWLAIHEDSLLALALLKTSGLVNHQHLMLLLDFYLRGLPRTAPGSSPSLACYSLSQSSSSLVIVSGELCQSLS